jgi:hypothetical protein
MDAYIRPDDAAHDPVQRGLERGVWPAGRAATEQRNIVSYGRGKLDESRTG